jgi:hypothetical protein
MVDKTGLKEKNPGELVKLLRYWLKLNENKHPERPFAHEYYLREMVRFVGLRDL